MRVDRRKWADQSEKRKKKTHRESWLDRSLNRERRVRWCKSERRLDQSLDRFVRGVDRSLFRRVCGVDRSLFRWVRGVDRSLDRSNVWLCRLRRAWIVVRRCGSFCLARCVGRSSQALREAVHVWERQCVWERNGKCLKWKFGLKLISVGFCLFYGQIENIFSLTQFTMPTKHAIFRKMISKFCFQPKQTDP